MNNDLVSRQWLLDEYDKRHEGPPGGARKLIEEAPPVADVRPVVRGHWVWNPNGMDWGLGAWCCDQCRIKAETWWANDRKNNPLRCSGGRFCGNCGADMREDAT